MYICVCACVYNGRYLYSSFPRKNYNNVQAFKESQITYLQCKWNVFMFTTIKSFYFKYSKITFSLLKVDVQ